MTNKSNYPPMICVVITTLCIFIVYFVFNNCKTNERFQNIFSRSFIQKSLRDNTTKNDIPFSIDYFKKYVQTEDELSIQWLDTIKRYIPFPLEDGYGSHKLVLLAASIVTGHDQSPVMEMGCGYHSTGLFHQIVVNEQKRFLLSTDTDRDWLEKFEANMTTSLHQFRHIAQTSDWDTVGIDRPRWSIIFVDHKPGDRRVVDIIRLANVTDIMIVHDTETEGYNYERGLAQFPYRYRFKYLKLHTDVVSKSNATLHQRIQRLLELTIKMNLPR